MYSASANADQALPNRKSPQNCIGLKVSLLETAGSSNINPASGIEQIDVCVVLCHSMLLLCRPRAASSCVRGCCLAAQQLLQQCKCIATLCSAQLEAHL